MLHARLTGESIGKEAGVGFETFAGALVRRGEAIAIVTATNPSRRSNRCRALPNHTF